MRSLKAVSEFDSFVSSKEFEILIVDSLLESFGFESCFHPVGSQLNFQKCRDLREQCSFHCTFDGISRFE